MSNEIERSILINRAKDLIQFNSNFSRIYFGNEFCQHLIPPLKDFRKAINFARTNDIELTILTPYVDCVGINKIEELLNFLNSHPSLEIVVNDLGVLNLVIHKFRRRNVVFGRTFVTLVSSDKTPDFISYLNIKRVETDDPSMIQSLPFNQKSLYYPFTFVATTRYCPLAACKKAEIPTGIIQCEKECEKYSFKVKNLNFIQETILRGNSQFIRKRTRISNNFCKTYGINRLVFQPYVPC